MQKELTETKELSEIEQLIIRLNQKLNSLTYYESRFGEILRKLIGFQQDIKEIKSDIGVIKRQVVTVDQVK